VDLTIQEAVKYLKGPRGSEVVITIDRVGLDEPLSFRIVRDKIDTPSVSNAFMIRPASGTSSSRTSPRPARTTSTERSHP